MKLLITGGAGFVGVRLARTLLANDKGSGSLAGRRIESLVLADLVAPPPDLQADPRVSVRTGPLLDLCAALGREGFDGVFHLASAVSGECELDFDLGMRSNLDTTRALLDGLRAANNRPRFVFSSSVAVFGPDPGRPLPDVVADDTLATPQTSYGAQKLMCEQLIADCTRKGFVDGRSARLMTVTVRPGKPNAAASSFFSGIIREPIAGEEAICPVPATVSHPLTSVARTVKGLVAIYEASVEQLVGRLALNLPAVNATVGQMLEALEEVAGKAVRERVRFERDETVAGIVGNWSRGCTDRKSVV